MLSFAYYFGCINSRWQTEIALGTLHWLRPMLYMSVWQKWAHIILRDAVQYCIANDLGELPSSEAVDGGGKLELMNEHNVK